MKFNRAFIVVALVTIAFTGFFSSCKKDLPDAINGALSFSTDTVQFDTIFTTLGSVTKAFKVYNPGNTTLTIDEIRLAGGNTSQFRLNIDGTPTIKLTDIELESGDSIYIFVEVTIDPQNLNTPFVVEDSVVFVSGSSVQDVKLVAWGQDAHYFYATNKNDQGLPSLSVLPCTGGGTVWTDDKPYVIFGSLIVPAGCTLTIEAGCDIRFYKNSNLVIDSAATLIVNGLPEQKVEFKGTRNDAYLKDTPGQWGTYVQILENGQVLRYNVGGIWLFRKSTAIINHAIIKNANRGLQADALSNLTLTNTELYNHNEVGLLASFATIRGYNVVAANAGVHAVAIFNGGNYNFRHCTFANYWSNSVRQTPTLMLNNYNSTTAFPITAYFGNSIVYGNVDNEIDFDLITTPTPNVLFEKSLIKIDPEYDITTSPVTFTSIIKNPFGNFGFEATFDNDYRLDTLTVAQDAADVNITNQIPPITTDVTGTINRNIGAAPDMGAFEREY